MGPSRVLPGAGQGQGRGRCLRRKRRERLGLGGIAALHRAMGASASAPLDDGKCAYIRGTGLGNRGQRCAPGAPGLGKAAGSAPGAPGGRESRRQRSGSPAHPGQRSAAGGTARVGLILSVRWSLEHFLKGDALEVPAEGVISRR